jgi:hypothetical protein
MYPSYNHESIYHIALVQGSTQANINKKRKKRSQKEELRQVIEFTTGRI